MPLVLHDLEHAHEDDAGDTPDDQGPQRMHHVRPRANGDETGQRSVVHETGITLADDQRGQNATDHRHQ